MKNLCILGTKSATSGNYYYLSYSIFHCVFIIACAVTYSQNFTLNTNPVSQCTAWISFVAGLTCSTYYTVHIYGSKDTTGITITDSSVATAIATALRTGIAYTGISNGYTMKVGTCGGGIGAPSGYVELSSTGGTCGCNPGYTVRPCQGGSWGGLYGTPCNAATQTMTVSFT